jgi:transketolase C-terminal domain/subunit
MTRKENHLAGLLSQRLLRKKDARDKLISLEDDCIRFNMVENVRKRFSDTFRQANEKLKE